MDKLQKLKPFVGIGIVGLLLVCIFIAPTEVISSSKSGIQLWFNSVFPALFPFIVCANLLIGLGAVSFVSVMLEPIMKPLFNVSGSGAFTMVMGMVSGYPVGAKITANLYTEGSISKTEAERILSFSNNAGPLFMLGAVGVGLFGNATIGFYILGVHYISAIINGLIFRFYKKNEPLKATSKSRGTSLFQKAYRSLRKHKDNEKRGFGLILADSVRTAMDISVQVGGYIILFSIIGKILNVTGVINLISNHVSNILLFANADKSIIGGIMLGILEMTNGVSAIASSSATLSVQVAASCFIIGLGGLSIHAQSTSIISETDLSIKTYTISKISHGIISTIIALLMFHILQL